MNVSEAVDSRMSCRAFTSQPVAGEIVRGILDKARRAPSGGNIQPWHVYALGGDPLRGLLADIQTKLATHPEGEGAEFDVYPKLLKEPYRSRRFKCGEDLYATINIPRSDRPARLRQFARNYAAFDAPVVLFVAIDRQMGLGQWVDLGMFLQTILLLAREQGLHTCTQQSWAVWHQSIASYFQIPPELMLFCGIALGYRDDSAPINRLRTERAKVEEFTVFRGI